MPKKPQQRPARRATPRPASQPEQAVVPQTAPEAAAAPHAAAPPGRTEIWPIARLKAHYQQAAMFHDLEGPEFEDFVADIARRGILDPIPVTPDGEMIDGHQRKRAAERLGMTAVPVRVRDELAGDRTAIDLAHLRANKTRRQLDGLDMARLARREMELECGRRWVDFSGEQKERLYDLLHANYGYERRHAQRLMKILGTPMAVQRAVSGKRLKMLLAERVYQLGWTKQEQIALEIEAGGDPSEIVARHLPKPARKVKPDDAYERLVAELVRGLDSLEGREEEIRRPTSCIRSDLEAFERFEQLREIVVPMLTRHLEEFERAREEFMAEYGYGDTYDELDAAVA